MKKNKAKLANPSFEEYYASIYGYRWSALKEAMLGFKKQKILTEGLREPYVLNEASWAAAQALQAEPGMDVLDMCAAPGGKSLALALALKGMGSLTANDRSANRFFRMQRILATLKDPYSRTVKLSRFDAQRYSFLSSQRFDRVLVDAPCSSEAHLLANVKYLQQWSLSRSKRLAVQQLSILCQALELCKPGGKILYATCALSPLENDSVIERLHKKRAGAFTIEPLANYGEPSLYGRNVLPDFEVGAGPLYFCLLQKKRDAP